MLALKEITQRAAHVGDSRYVSLVIRRSTAPGPWPAQKVLRIFPLTGRGLVAVECLSSNPRPFLESFLGDTHRAQRPRRPIGIQNSMKGCQIARRSYVKGAPARKFSLPHALLKRSTGPHDRVKRPMMQQRRFQSDHGCDIEWHRANPFWNVSPLAAPPHHVPARSRWLPSSSNAESQRAARCGAVQRDCIAGGFTRGDKYVSMQ